MALLIDRFFNFADIRLYAGYLRLFLFCLLFTLSTNHGNNSCSHSRA